MTPGYHVVAASLVRAIGHEQTVVRAANIAWSLACLVLLLVALNRYAGPWGMLLVVPLLLSPYFNYSAIWLRPDNSAWLMVLGIMVLCLSGPMTTTRLICAGALMAVLVFFRHAHLWCAAVIWAAAFADPSRNTAMRFRKTAYAVIATLPAFAIVLYFYRLWHGLVPPRFKSVEGALPTEHSGWQHVGPNWSVPVIVIGLLGVLSIVFLPVVWKSLRMIWNKHAGKILLCGLIVAIVCTIPPSSQTPLIPNTVGARYSGLWNIAGRLPTIADRSPFMIATCFLGGMVALMWFYLLPVRWRWIMGMAFIAFLAAQIANAEAWQKYYEPYLLMWLPLATVGVMVHHRPVKQD